jgi:hypothetical protein
MENLNPKFYIPLLSYFVFVPSIAIIASYYVPLYAGGLIIISSVIWGLGLALVAHGKNNKIIQKSFYTNKKSGEPNGALLVLLPIVILVIGLALSLVSIHFTYGGIW